MIIKQLGYSDINVDILNNFNHYHKITHHWQKKESGWSLEDAPIIHQWDDEKKKWISSEYMPLHLERGGAVLGAFDGNNLIGFALIDGRLLGSRNQYVNLSMLFIASGYKRKGIGSQLFAAACDKARSLKAEKLFISAIAAKDTIAFYKKNGCVDAQEIID
jgi:GNAT superfamily N-acetyltransferase